jgi:4-hydroxybenzoate polyprenyltransferase
MNKKTLLASIVFAVVLLTLAITGAFFCNWAGYLIPLAIVPITIWAFRNKKYFSMKFNKELRTTKNA